MRSFRLFTASVLSMTLLAGCGRDEPVSESRYKPVDALFAQLTGEVDSASDLSLVVEIDGTERDVNFLRVGRIALLYQTTDTEISGAWDQASRSWVPLERGEYRNAIMKGLRIARKEASIDLMNLPVAAPEAQ